MCALWFGWRNMPGLGGFFSLLKLYTLLISQLRWKVTVALARLQQFITTRQQIMNQAGLITASFQCEATTMRDSNAINHSLSFPPDQVLCDYPVNEWMNERMKKTTPHSGLQQLLPGITFLTLHDIWHWEQVCQGSCWAKQATFLKQMEIKKGGTRRLYADPSHSYPQWSLSPFYLYCFCVLFNMLYIREERRGSESEKKEKRD